MFTIYNIPFYKNNQYHIHIDPVNFCNFSCNYCYAYQDIIKKQSIDTKLLLQFLLYNKFNTKNVQLYFLGGEPTLYSDLLYICNNLTLCKKHIYTNFSANILLYKNLLKNNIYITISYHISQFDEQLFFEKLNYFSINEQKNIDIILMYEIGFEQKIIADYKYLKANYKFKSIEIQLISSVHKYKNAYTKNSIKMIQDNYLNEQKYIADYCITNNSSFYKYVSEDYLMDILFPNGFKNKLCNASIECLFINAYGDIYSCPSMFYNFNNKYKIGNIKQLKFFKKQVLCKCTNCCTPFITKYSLTLNDKIV